MTTITLTGSYQLQPNDCRKSFYGKAIVKCYSDGTKVLQSYKTDVCALRPDGTIERLWDGYSATTQRHIRAFLGLNKKEYEKATYESAWKVECYRDPFSREMYTNMDW